MPNKVNKTPTGNNASSFLEDTDKDNTIVTRSSTEVGLFTVSKITHEV